MGKDLPDIMEGDGVVEIISEIIELFGLKYCDYLDNKSIITRQIVEKSLDIILKELEWQEKSNSIVIRNNYICYLQILGYFILKTGAHIPDELKHKIAEAATPENDTVQFYDKKFQEMREIVLKDLREKILNHQPGKVSLLIEDGGKPLHVPKIIIPIEKIDALMEKGCSLQRITELLDMEFSEKITPTLILENIQYHYPLIALDFTNVFDNARKLLLKPIIKQKLEQGISTPEKMHEIFLSNENPESIPLNELNEIIQLIKKEGKLKYR